ncbi:putative ribonuclease H-like domain-containing protein [Tanacetum coccineum]
MASESASTTTGVGSTSALTIREIIPTNRPHECGKDLNMCIMTNGQKKRLMQAQQNQNPEAGQTSMGRDGQIFMYNPDYLREQFAGLVIQRGLSFNTLTTSRQRGCSRTLCNQDTLIISYREYSRDLEFQDDSFATRSLDWFHESFQAKENQFLVLSRMAMDILSVQASSVASESAFSTSGRLLTIRRTRLTPESLEMCMCLKDHLDAQERKQDTSPLELPLDVEEGVFNVEVQQNEATQLTDQEIALDASSDSSSGEPRHDYMMSSGAEDDQTGDGHDGPTSDGFQRDMTSVGNASLNCITYRHIELMELFLSVGVDVDSQSDSGTPLVWAAGHAQQDAVKLLLKHKADPNIETDDGVNLLLCTVAAGSLPCLELLIEVERGITLTLAPKSARALSKKTLLIKQGKVKLPGSFSFLVVTAYWEDPIQRIGYESASTIVEIDLTWSLGLVSVELGRLPNPLSCRTLLIFPIWISKVLIDAPWFLMEASVEAQSILSTWRSPHVKDIKKEFSVARTPQQNDVAERRIRTLIEAARTLLADSKLPTTFWSELVRTHALSFMRPFGCHVTILNTLDYLGKFDGKSDEGFFIGYSMNSKAFKVYNIRTRKVEENLHIRFLEDKPIIAGDRPKWLFDIDVLKKSMNYMPVVAGTNSNDLVDGSLFDSSSKNASNDEPQPSSDAGKKMMKVLIINIVSPTVTTAPLEATHADFFGDETEVDMSNITTTYPVPSTPNIRIHKDHSLDHVIGDVQSGEEPKKVIQALKDPSWIEAMQEELLQFKLQQVWTLVDLPHGKRAIGTKWVYRNKKDERGIMIKNKTRLVAQGYTQEERIDYDEVFAPVARIEAIRLFLAYASFKDFIVYQMDVKSAFLYGKIEEEVYVCQPPGFEDLEFPDRVYKVENALYDLHQAPRAWYDTFSTYLLDNGFQRGQIDKTFFIKRVNSDILLVQVYVDDIIFRSTKTELCTEFEKLMDKKFQMSSMGELTFFLRLQVTQKDDGIFISQDKYVDEILKKFGFLTVKTASTPIETSKTLMKDENAEDVDVHLYRSMIGSLMYLTSSRPDIMFAVCACARFQVTPKVSHLHAVKRIFRYLKGQDRKSITGGCQFLGSRLISWQCKKQTIVANSTTEAEYVAAASCCGQTKHIEIRYHFIRDSNEKKLIQIIKIHTDQNVTDLLTKAFDVGRFQYLIASIGMLNL